MEKKQMCRICLAENVRMYVVVSKKFHELYERLTDIPFVTEDSRPILACFICYAQLKKCYRFLNKILDAEEQFARMTLMNEDYECKPLINQDQFEFFHGFIRTPIDTISIVDVDETESIVVKEELLAVCERLDDIIEPKEEHESNADQKTVNIYDNYVVKEDTPLHPQIKEIGLHHSKSDSVGDVPLTEVKTEIEEQEVSKMEQETHNQKTVNIYDNYVVKEDTPLHPQIKEIGLHHSKSDSVGDVPLMEVKTEVEEQEVSKMQQETHNQKTVNIYDNYVVKEDTPLHPQIKEIGLHHSKSDSVGDVPLMEVKTEVEEQEVSKMQQETHNQKTVNIYDNYVVKEDTPLHPQIKEIGLHHSKSDSVGDVPLMEVKTGVEEHEVSKMEQETHSVPVKKQRKLETTTLGHKITGEHNYVVPVLTKKGVPVKKQRKLETTTLGHKITREHNYCRKSIQDSQDCTSKSRLYNCDKCYRRFINKDNLKWHMYAHRTWICQ